MLTLSNLLHLSHLVVRQCCKPGDTVMDATTGNGKDTVLLAQLVGEEGIVLAMDKQMDALEKAKSLLDVMDLLPRVRLLHAEHKDMREALRSVPPERLRRGLNVVVFNLGYLPGGDKKIITDPASTLAALDTVWQLLKPGGLLSVHCYTGHTGAREEADAVGHWMARIPWNEAQVTACAQHNKMESKEVLYLVTKNQQ